MLPGYRSMNQLSFEEYARARNTDPETSHQAAASIDKLLERQRDVYNAFLMFGPVPDHVLVNGMQSLAKLGRVKHQSESGIRTRRSELVEKGLVEDTGERVVLPSGRKSIVWRIKQ